MSVFKHSPVNGFQIFTTLSSLPLASSPAIDHATSLTSPLPFPQMSGNIYVKVVYASPPLIVLNNAKYATFRMSGEKA